MLKKSYLILDSGQKKIFWFLAVLSLLCSTLELAGIGLLYPLFLVLLDESILQNQRYAEYASFFDLSYKEVVTLIIIGIIIVYVIKNIIVFLNKILVENFQKNFRIKILNKVLFKLFYFPFENAFKITSENQVKKINFCLEYSQVYKLLLFLLVEIITLTFIAIYLLYLNFNISIFLFLFFPALSYLIYKFSKDKIEFYGSQSLKLFEKLIKAILQSTAGIKEIRIAQKEKTMQNFLNQINIKDSNNRFKNNFFLYIPSHVIEVFSIFFITGIILISVNFFDTDNQKLVAILGVYAVAFARLMPATTRIISYLQMLKYNLPLTKIIHNEVVNVKSFNDTLIRKNNKFNINFKKNIRIKNLTFFYNNSKKIFKDLNIEIQKNKIFGIKGKSGAGKTTLLNIILGLLTPKTGSIFIDNVELKRSNLHAWQKKIGLVPQNPFFLNDTILKNVCFLSDYKKENLERILKCLKIAQLYEEIKKLPGGIETIIGENGKNLSGGQLQRLALARALYNKPDVLILDEATSALDQANEEKILKILKNLKGKITIIIVSHKMSNMRICDKIYSVK